MVLYAEKHFLGGHQLNIMQVSYNTSVKSSVGTHAGVGAVDVYWDYNHSCTGVVAMRKAGFAAWHRTPAQGDWGYHVHAIAIKDLEMSDAAASQIKDYYNHLNGLASHAYDPAWRPNPIPVWGVDIPHETAAELGYPGPTPTRLFQAVLRKQWQHEIYGYYTMTDVESLYVTKYNKSMEIIAERHGIAVDSTWSLNAHTHAFQRAVGLTNDGYPGPVTAQKLASLAGYKYIAI